MSRSSELIDESIGKFIKKGEKLFGYTDSGEAIFSIGIKDKSKSEKVFDVKDAIIFDMDLMGDTLWLATIPNYSWEEMPIPERK